MFMGLMRCVVVLAVAIATASAAARAEHDAPTPAQSELEKAIHDYLVEHPEVIIEAVQSLRQRQQAAEAERTRSRIAEHRDALFNDPASPIGGNAEGDVTVVEFFDYQCPYCKQVSSRVTKIVEEDPGLRVIYKEFPILGPASELAARAALASRAQDPGHYVAFHTALMSSRGKLTESRIMAIAREVGLEVERLRADMEAPEVERAIERNKSLARALGITGTPSFVIGEQLVPGAVGFDDLKRLVAQARSS